MLIYDDEGLTSANRDQGGEAGGRLGMSVRGARAKGIDIQPFEIGGHLEHTWVCACACRCVSMPVCVRVCVCVSRGGMQTCSGIKYKVYEYMVCVALAVGAGFSRNLEPRSSPLSLSSPRAKEPSASPQRCFSPYSGYAHTRGPQPRHCPGVQSCRDNLLQQKQAKTSRRHPLAGAISPLSDT